jgi:hypothetical protein
MLKIIFLMLKIGLKFIQILDLKYEKVFNFFSKTNLFNCK